MTIKDLVTSALREINVIDYNESPSSDDLLFGLNRFILLADAWEADRLTIQPTLRKTFDLVANQASYTIGPGGDWDDYRPEWIAAAGFVNTYVNPSNPLETPVDVYPDEIWARIELKTLTSTIVWGIWYERTFTPNIANTTGLGTVFVHPIITNIGKIALYYPVPFANVTQDLAGLATEVILPPGYKRALIYNLAMDIADGFEKAPSASLVAKAASSLTVIKRANIRPGISRLPKRLMRRVRRGYNILVNQ